MLCLCSFVPSRAKIQTIVLVIVFALEMKQIRVLCRAPGHRTRDWPPKKVVLCPFKMILRAHFKDIWDKSGTNFTW